ncbi:MAG: hypothetical protein ABR582_11910 [Gemmatimonadaceae bacterium]
MATLRSFLTGIVDYAGLFPPANLDMQAAVKNYAEYRAGGDRELLGRFVVPASRLAEFGDASRALLDRGEGSVPWCLSVIVDGDIAEARKTILGFTATHITRSESGHALCDAVEVRSRNEEDVGEASAAFPQPIHRFFEVSPNEEMRSLLRAVAARRGSAKIRTGGVKKDAFPRSEEVLRFIRACNDLAIPFKATAGLHHALCGTYPLTYDTGSARGKMYGFINILLASAFIRSGVTEPEAVELLEESSADAFSVHEGGLTWRSHELSRDDLRTTRDKLFLSFGSCSFTEPVDEARALGFIR